MGAKRSEMSGNIDPVLIGGGGGGLNSISPVEQISKDEVRLVPTTLAPTEEAELKLFQ